MALAPRGGSDGVGVVCRAAASASWYFSIERALSTLSLGQPPHLSSTSRSAASGSRVSSHAGHTANSCAADDHDMRCAILCSAAMTAANHAEKIRGSCAECFAAITDFASYPEWQSAVVAVEVRSLDEEGRGREVAFMIDLKLRRIRYVLLYDYTEPTDIQ